MDVTHSSAIVFWSGLKDFLKISTDSKGGTLRISNEAPDDPDQPRIVFKDLSWRATGGLTSGTFKSRLEPGESAEIDLTARGLSNSAITIIASVDHKQFFRVAVTQPYTPEQVSAIHTWLDAERGYNIWGHLENLRAGLPAIDENMTLGDMRSLREAPDRVVGLLKGFINEVGELTFVPDRLRPDRTARRTAKEFAVDLRALNEAIKNQVISTMIEARNSVTSFEFPPQEFRRQVAEIRERYLA